MLTTATNVQYLNFQCHCISKFWSLRDVRMTNESPPPQPPAVAPRPPPAPAGPGRRCPRGPRRRRGRPPGCGWRSPNGTAAAPARPEFVLWWGEHQGFPLPNPFINGRGCLHRLAFVNRMEEGGKPTACVCHSWGLHISSFNFPATPPGNSSPHVPPMGTLPLPPPPAKLPPPWMGRPPPAGHPRLFRRRSRRVRARGPLTKPFARWIV